MPSQSATSSETSEHHHYWPDGLVPITPQARQYGFVMDVYVTPHLWRTTCTWTEGHGKNTDYRLLELIQSCYGGMAKALSTCDDMVSYTFKHWYSRRDRPKAKKKIRMKVGARLLLHPETEEPWLLLFDPDYDFKDQLKKGEAPDDTAGEHRENANSDDIEGDESGSELDPAN